MKYAQKKGFRKPQKILSTDFLVEYQDHSFEAISVKPNKSAYDEPLRCTNREKNRINRRKELLEMQKTYWMDYYGIPFEEVYSDDLDSRYSTNIERCMAYYDFDASDTNEVHLFQHLIARQIITVDLRGRYICFRELLENYRHEVKAITDKNS